MLRHVLGLLMLVSEARSTSPDKTLQQQGIDDKIDALDKKIHNAREALHRQYGYEGYLKGLQAKLNHVQSQHARNGRPNPSHVSKQENCGAMGQPACVAGDGNHWCMSPATDGVTDVYAVKERNSDAIVCKACGILGQEACLDAVTNADWCMSPANVDGSTVQATLDESTGKLMCTACGDAGKPACLDPNDNSIHSCKSPDANGNAVTAVEDPGAGGSYMHFRCQAANSPTVAGRATLKDERHP